MDVQRHLQRAGRDVARARRRTCAPGDPQGSDTARCGQTVTVRPNTAYQLSAWVQGAYVFLGATGGGVEAGTWGAPGAQWAQLRTSFTTGPSTTSVTVHVNGWYGQGAYLADDVVLDGPGGTPDTHAPTVPGNVAVGGATTSGGGSPRRLMVGYLHVESEADFIAAIRAKQAQGKC